MTSVCITIYDIGKQPWVVDTSRNDNYESLLMHFYTICLKEELYIIFWYKYQFELGFITGRLTWRLIAMKLRQVNVKHIERHQAFILLREWRQSASALPLRTFAEIEQDRPARLKKWIKSFEIYCETYFGYRL